MLNKDLLGKPLHIHCSQQLCFPTSPTPPTPPSLLPLLPHFSTISELTSFELSSRKDS